MNESMSPSLTEPGVRYFLRETLKQCHEKVYTYHSTLVNSGLLFLFLMLLGVILIYKKRTKPTEDEVHAKHAEQRDYILNKIKEMQVEKDKENNQIITSLPKFESNFETLHKNYYKI